MSRYKNNPMRASSLAFAVLATSLLSLSATANTLNQEAAELVKKMSKGTVEIVKTFDAKEIGMTGVVVKRGGKPLVVYVDSRTKTMFSGVFITEDGTNLAQKYNDSEVPKPDMKAYWDKAQQTAYVSYGSDKAPALFYVLGESNCGYCKRLHNEIKPLVKAGKVQVRWILLGFNDQADDKAAGVLTAIDPVSAIEDLYERGVAPKGTPAGMGKVKVNHAFSDAFSIGGTPFIISKNKAGDIVTTPGAISGKGLDDLIANSIR